MAEDRIADVFHDVTNSRQRVCLQRHSSAASVHTLGVALGKQCARHFVPSLNCIVRFACTETRVKTVA